jgi:formate hydrogenlyase transcriptional activator
MSTSESQSSITSDQNVPQERVDLTIIDAIPIPITVLTPDGVALYANQMALDGMGITLEEVKDKKLLGSICHPDDLDRIVDERRIGMSKGSPFELEMRLWFKNKEYRWRLVQYNPLKDESGKILRWYATASDIDDRKRAEEMLRAREMSWRQTTFPGSCMHWAQQATWSLSAARRASTSARRMRS